MYQYRADVLRVIDGDTVELSVDLGFNIRHVIRGRLLDVNAPEIFSGTDKANGALAKDFLAQLLSAEPQVVVNTYKDRMTFNRWVVELRTAAGDSLNARVAAYCAQLS